MFTQLTFFNIFSTAAIFFACAIIVFNSPLFSIFSLVVSLVFAILILFLLHVEFLAYIYLIVYVGAIVILFLFVIMLLNVREAAERERARGRPDLLLYFLIISKFIYLWASMRKQSFIFYMNENFSYIAKLTDTSHDILKIGLYMYTDYFFNFLLVSIILLISMIGAVVLGTNK